MSPTNHSTTAQLQFGTQVPRFQDSGGFLVAVWDVRWFLGFWQFSGGISAGCSGRRATPRNGWYRQAMAIESLQLADFNLDGQISLGGKLGLQRLRRADDGTLTLIVETNDLVPQSEISQPYGFAKRDAILGFVLDIGIQTERRLTYGNGFYFGDKVPPRQSQRIVSQKDFDPILLERLSVAVDSGFQSSAPERVAAAIRLQHLLDTYNGARLLFPLFAGESYLALMRIIDATAPREARAVGFALHGATQDPSMASAIVDRITTVSSYAERVKLAEDIHQQALEEATRKKWPKQGALQGLDSAARFVFGSLFSAYQYRNVFLHRGFPFPDHIKEAWGISDDAGTSYLHPSLGSSWLKVHRTSGVESGDLVDIHEVLEAEKADYQERFYLLLPTWHFMKRIARSALLSLVSATSNEEAV